MLIEGSLSAYGNALRSGADLDTVASGVFRRRWKKEPEPEIACDYAWPSSASVVRVSGCLYVVFSSQNRQATDLSRRGRTHAKWSLHERATGGTRSRGRLVTGDTRVLFIAGWGRSGSTILDMVLGQVDGLVSVGELKFVWERGLLQNRRCGCGEAFKDCPFWAKVFEEVHGSAGRDELAETLDRDSKGFRTRHLPLLMVPPVFQAYVRRFPDYQSHLRHLYAGILRTSGAQVVVDSSKFPTYLALLQRTSGLAVHTVHIVRDPRAVAHSWARSKPDPDNPVTDMMHRMHPAVTGAYWTSWNAAIERIGRSESRYMRIRYEDLVAAPRSTVESILDFAEVQGVELPFIDEKTVTLTPSHTVSGNPVRFTTGTMKIMEDRAWLTEMSDSDRRWAEITSTPLRGHYGYP